MQYKNEFVKDILNVDLFKNQIEFIECDDKYIAINIDKGNTGKTFAALVYTLMYASSSANFNTVFVAPCYRPLMNARQTMLDLIANSKYPNILARSGLYYIKLKNGSFINFVCPEDFNKLHGVRPHLIVVDDTTLIPLDVWVSTFMYATRGECRIVFVNHNNSNFTNIKFNE